MREQRNEAAVDGVSGEAEIEGQFKNAAAVSLSLPSSPSMIQLSEGSAGFTGPRINGWPRSWLDSRGALGGHALRTARLQSQLCMVFAGCEQR